MLAAAAAAVPASSRNVGGAGLGHAPVAEEDKIKICLIWGNRNAHLEKLAEQIGVTHAIANTDHVLRDVPRNQYPDALAKLKAGYDAAGLKIAGIESHPVPAQKIKLGLPGRDEEIENYIAALKALGEVGIPMVCYEFCAGTGWYRSNMDTPGRGGCSTMSFDLQDANHQGLTQYGRVSEEQMWSSMEYFQKAIIPAAEKAGVQMALHPDDPPVAELRGIARICNSAANYRRIMNIVPSPINGVTLELSVFTLMGEDIKALAKEWTRERKIFFIHARNLQGTRDHFIETFQDDGKIDFGEVFQVLYENGWRGPLRPDHDPILDGEKEEGKLFDYPVHPGYGVLGKIFAAGYIKGILASRHIPYA